MSSLRDAFDGYDLYYGDDDDDCSLLVRRSVPDDQAEEETDSACYKIGRPPAPSLFSSNIFYSADAWGRSAPPLLGVLDL